MNIMMTCRMIALLLGAIVGQVIYAAYTDQDYGQALSNAWWQGTALGGLALSLWLFP
jgi:hypothetical protein